MAKIRKRGNSYQIDYFDATGKRVRKSFSKRKDAEAELGKRVSLIAENRYLDVKKDYKTTLGELIEKYTENYKHQSYYQSQRSKKYFLNDVKKYFGAGTLLSNIRYVDIETYFNKLRRGVTRQGGALAEASINRQINCLHHLFVKGQQWKLIEDNPFDGGKIERKKENKRIRYLLKDEITRLLDECSAKAFLHRVVVCAINTGMDKGVILDLKWKDIRNDHIYTIRKKTDKPLKIPVNGELAAMFKDIRKEQGLGSEYIFTKKGKRIKNINAAFNAAVRRAGIDDFTFRDLRHTFASHLAMNGRPLNEIQELMGHENIQMTMRYAHLGPEQKKDAVNSLNGLTGYVKTDMSQNVTSRNEAVVAS